MKNLYQYAFGYRPHYVVAENYADAERVIKDDLGGHARIERIDCLGPYVLVSDKIEIPPPQTIPPVTASEEEGR